MFFIGGAKRKRLQGHALKKWQERPKSLLLVISEQLCGAGK